MSNSMQESAPNKLEILKALEFGNPVAEEEREHLARYFVETNTWDEIYNGKVDVVYGPKGSGKSALYLLVQDHIDGFFDKGVLLVPAENIRGAPAFEDLTADPPTSEREFINLWKLYFLMLVGRAIKDWGISGPYTDAVLKALQEADLLPPDSMSLSSILKTVQEYVRRYMSWKAIEGTLNIDPVSGLPNGLTGRIVFDEPTAEERKSGLVTANELFANVNKSLEKAKIYIWLLLDRLDVAFDESEELEKNALRALFRAYRDIQVNERICLKIFLRTDIWRRITEEGFREATHITADVNLTWDAHALLNIVVRRMLANDSLVEYLKLEPEKVLQDAELQKKVFYHIFPEQVEAGERQSNTFDWILKRTVDGSGQNMPRELIMYLNSLRRVQISRYERGEAAPANGVLFERVSFKEALPSISEDKLNRALYAEFPDQRKFIEKLRGEKSEQTPSSLSKIWNMSEAEALERAEELVEIGFFEARGTRDSLTFWVPFLFRPALDLVQGKAEE